jgi:hypothetical protein
LALLIFKKTFPIRSHENANDPAFIERTTVSI